MRLSVITRCKNEPYIHEFVSYYIHEGVDRIFIYDDHSDKGAYDKISPEFLSKIEIITSNPPTTSKYELNTIPFVILYKYIIDYDWVINVDVDEFITSPDNKTIRDHLKESFKDVDCIKIPWVFMFPKNWEHVPISMLREIIHRRDYTHKVNKHKQIACNKSIFDIPDCKTIFNPKKYEKCNPHIPITENGITRIIDSVTHNPSAPNLWGGVLNETHISKATFLCYHYRMVSREHLKLKIAGHIYNTLSINNSITAFDYPEIEDLTLKNKADKYNI